MANKKLILVLFFIFFFSVTNVFHFHFFIPFKAIGDPDVSYAFGTTRNSETEVDEGDNPRSSTDSAPKVIRGTEVDEGDNPRSSTDSAPKVIRGTEVDEGDNPRSSTDSPENISPVADAGTDITVQSNKLTQLDGSKSYDPNDSGDDVRPSLSFDWTQTGGPEVILNNPTSANPTFTSPQVEEETRLTFQLVVSSDTATSDPDSVTVSAPIPTKLLYPT